MSRTLGLRSGWSRALVEIAMALMDPDRMMKAFLELARIFAKTYLSKDLILDDAKLLRVDKRCSNCVFSAPPN